MKGGGLILCSQLHIQFPGIEYEVDNIRLRPSFKAQSSTTPVLMPIDLAKPLTELP